LAAVPSTGRARPIERDAHALYERHHALVLRFCRSKLRTPEDAEDAAQTTFAHALRGLGRGVVPVSEPAWLLTIARNVCLNRWDAARRRSGVEVSRDPHVLQEVAAAAEDAPGQLLDLEDALAGLTDHQRRAILLREWQGLSYAEIADDLGVNEGAVETLLFRARRSLARRLRDLGSVLSGVKSLLGGGAAVTKVAVGLVAVSGAAAVAAPRLDRPADPRRTPAQAAARANGTPVAARALHAPVKRVPAERAAVPRRESIASHHASDPRARPAPPLRSTPPQAGAPTTRATQPEARQPARPPDAPPPPATPTAEAAPPAVAQVPSVPVPSLPKVETPALAPPALPSLPKVDLPAVPDVTATLPSVGVKTP
jgi:RNA polymerase sigma-70 factor (ECF subfamily)